MFRKKPTPWAFASAKSLLLAVLFFLAGTLFRGLVGVGHREKREKEEKPVWWVRLIVRLVGN